MPTPNSRIMLPQIALRQIVTETDIAQVDLYPLPYEDGALPDQEARALLALLVATGPKVILEIGTYHGATTLRIAHQLPTSQIHTIDLSLADAAQGPYLSDQHLITKRHLVGGHFLSRPQYANITQHYGNTHSYDFRRLGNPGFFFIDGSHSYFYVHNDSNKCLALCGDKGVFVWHDADPNHPGVLQLLEEWRRLGRDVRLIEGTRLGYWDSSA